MSIGRHYYVNDTRSEERDHEVHEQGCFWLSIAHKTTYLGSFSWCGPAVTAAKVKYPSANGCKHCSPICHTT
jgi:hypothetical protein